MDTDNRRQNYRHTFPPEHGLPVAVQRSTGGPFWKGGALDLSVTGTRLRLENDSHRLAVDDRVVLRFALPPSGERLQMHGEVIHTVCDEHGETYGIQFLPSLNSSADEHRDRVIWQFLMAEQRRAIPRLHGELEPYRHTGPSFEDAAPSNPVIMHARDVVHLVAHIGPLRVSALGEVP